MTSILNDDDSHFRVTVKARMYHGILHETMTRLGQSRREFATYLGVSYVRLCSLLSMKYVPNFKTKKGKVLKQNLEDVTGFSVSELFPGHIFTEEFLGQDKTIEVTRDVPSHLLVNAGAVHQLSFSPDELMIQKEEEGVDFVKILEPVLKTLSQRDRLVIRLRFFEGKTYSECIPSMNVKYVESVKQAETKALSRLREPMRMRILKTLTRNGHVQSLDEIRFNRWMNQTILANSKVFESKGR